MWISTGGVELDSALSKRIWRPRPIGILYTHSEEHGWIFLVLISPISSQDNERSDSSSKDDNGEFMFCYHEPFSRSFEPFSYTDDSGLAYEVSIDDIVGYVGRTVEHKNVKMLNHILSDVLWGWERYLAAMRNDIRGVKATYSFVTNLRLR